MNKKKITKKIRLIIALSLVMSSTVTGTAYAYEGENDDVQETAYYDDDIEIAEESGTEMVSEIIDETQVQTTEEYSEIETETYSESESIIETETGVDNNNESKTTDETEIYLDSQIQTEESDVLLETAVIDNNSTAETRVSIPECNYVLAGEPDDSINGIRMDGFIQEGLTYTGQKIVQNLKIYDGETQLKEGKDYQLQYKNNINAADYADKNAPSVKLIFKGQYKGDKVFYFSIAKRDINSLIIRDLFASVPYTGRPQKYTPTILDGNKRLVANKDFSINYEDVSYIGTKGSTQKIGFTLTGKNNYGGNAEGEYYIADDKVDLSKSKITLKLTKNKYLYDGTDITKDKIISEFQVKKDGKYVTEDIPADMVHISIDKILGTATLRIFAKKGDDISAVKYTGCFEKKFNITGAYDIKTDVTFNEAAWKNEMLYDKSIATNGGFRQDMTNMLKDKSGKALVEGEDYQLKYSNNTRAGKVTVTITGINKFQGTLKKTFSVIAKTDFKIDPIGSVQYTKGAVTPTITVRDSANNILQINKEYRIIWKDNKKVGTAYYTIKGAGQYAKSESKEGTFAIVNGDISKCTVKTAGVPYQEKSGFYKKAPQVIDINGKMLQAGIDYEKEVIFSYAGSDQQDTPSPGTVISVQVKGIGNYSGSTVTGTFNIYDKKNTIQKLGIAIDTQIYSGQPIEPSLYNKTTNTKGSIHVYPTANDMKNKTNELEADKYVEIVSYSKNINSGKGQVSLKGIGTYGGTKNMQFTIAPKKYDALSVTEIELDKTNVQLKVGKDTTLTGSVKPANVKCKDIYFKSSNEKIATVTKIDNTSVKINAISGGDCVIQAISVDSKVTKECKVHVDEAAATEISCSKHEITGNIGGSEKIKVESQSEDPSALIIKYLSSDNTIASVDDDGTVKFLKDGICYIRVFANKGTAFDYCKIIVKNPNISNLTRFDVTDNGVVPNDDTKGTANRAAIENLCYKKENRIIYFPAGTYTIELRPASTGDTSHGYGIDVGEAQNVHFVLDENAIIKCKSNNYKGYEIFSFTKCINCSISGGKLIGDKSSHTGTQGEWGEGIALYGCEYMTIDSMDISNCWGDGIDISSNSYTTTNTHITVSNCNIHDNRRNNLSITAGDYISVDKCKLNDAKGKDPQLGVDIETNDKSNPCEHLFFNECTIKGNSGGAFSIAAPANDVVFKDCDMDGRQINGFGDNVKIIKGSTETIMKKTPW